MVTGQEKFQKFIVGLMTTVIHHDDDFVPQNVPMKEVKKFYITKIHLNYKIVFLFSDQEGILSTTSLSL
jgi:hypothetical protein